MLLFRGCPQKIFLILTRITQQCHTHHCAIVAEINRGLAHGYSTSFNGFLKKSLHSAPNRTQKWVAVQVMSDDHEKLVRSNVTCTLSK